MPALADTAPAGYAFSAKDVTSAPLDCGSGNRVPCIGQAPNTGAQYLQGHVLDQAGQGVGGMTVWVGSSGGGVQTVLTDGDGLFTAVLFPQSHSADTHCPIFPSFSGRSYSVWLTDPGGLLASDTRSFMYYNCGIAGEFHFDFLKTN